MKSIKGARTWRSILSTQIFFWPLTHPPTHPQPPPRYSINQPLSKGLAGPLWTTACHDPGRWLGSEWNRGFGCRGVAHRRTRHWHPPGWTRSAGSGSHWPGHGPRLVPNERDRGGGYWRVNGEGAS